MDFEDGCFPVMFVAIVIILVILAVFTDAFKSSPPPPNMFLIPSVQQPESHQKWTATLEGEFEDSRSYSGFHRIYRLKSADGVEIIGVTGMSVWEPGSHKSGKTTIGDER